MGWELGLFSPEALSQSPYPAALHVSHQGCELSIAQVPFWSTETLCDSRTADSLIVLDFCAGF